MTLARTAVALVAVLLAVPVAFAQSTETKTPAAAKGEPESASTGSPAATAESPLVKAARDGAAKRSKKSRLSIDDKDVKKSAGKLIESTSKPLTPIPAATDVDKRLRAERAAADALKDPPAAKALEARVAAAQREVDSLESELRRIEETYYDEDDPDFREDVIEKNFVETSARLEKARQALEAARKDAARYGGVSTP